MDTSATIPSQEANSVGPACELTSEQFKLGTLLEQATCKPLPIISVLGLQDQHITVKPKDCLSVYHDGAPKHAGDPSWSELFTFWFVVIDEISELDGQSCFSGRWFYKYSDLDMTDGHIKRHLRRAPPADLELFLSDETAMFTEWCVRDKVSVAHVRKRSAPPATGLWYRRIFSISTGKISILLLSISILRIQSTLSALVRSRSQAVHQYFSLHPSCTPPRVS
ncbi:hypothetical protein HYDPIDRAFT_169895 [Hydnomerulius pinastri MD-312]|uniref:Unplaced genomic scaffold scaffold_32, whole genome shotgun sequence n=1 Tax=Hydnomerulius pinastri MD-312 TaxID=994086 RepID=A0A0C9WB85_9AGAM|nr:hypothetical protein HYDPIDRAFT_169895 [Hydnomerulius pinastri MD-312]